MVFNLSSGSDGEGSTYNITLGLQLISGSVPRPVSPGTNALYLAGASEKDLKTDLCIGHDTPELRDNLVWIRTVETGGNAIDIPIVSDFLNAVWRLQIYKVYQYTGENGWLEVTSFLYDVDKGAWFRL